MELYFQSTSLKDFDKALESSVYIFECFRDSECFVDVHIKNFLILNFLARKELNISLDSLPKQINLRGKCYNLGFVIRRLPDHFTCVAPHNDYFLHFDCLARTPNIMKGNEKIIPLFVFYVPEDE